jgi:hypothetical protein
MKKTVTILSLIFFLGTMHMDFAMNKTTGKYASAACGFVGLLSLAKQIYDKDYTTKTNLFTSGFLTTSFFGALYSFGLFSTKKNQQPSKLLSDTIENGFPMSLKQLKAAYCKTAGWKNHTIYNNRANILHFSNKVTIQSNGCLTKYCYDLSELTGVFVWLGDKKKLIYNETGQVVLREDS